MAELDFFKNYFLFTPELFIPELSIFLRLFTNIFTRAEFWRVSHFMPGIKDNLLCAKIRSWLPQRALLLYSAPRLRPQGWAHTRAASFVPSQSWGMNHNSFQGRSGRCEAHTDIKKRKKKKEKNPTKRSLLHHARFNVHHGTENKGWCISWEAQDQQDLHTRQICSWP